MNFILAKIPNTIEIVVFSEILKRFLKKKRLLGVAFHHLLKLNLLKALALGRKLISKKQKKFFFNLKVNNKKIMK
jgi:hypothetical protein